jgi:hypothetical protein
MVPGSGLYSTVIRTVIAFQKEDFEEEVEGWGLGTHEGLLPDLLEEIPRQGYPASGVRF